MVETRITNSSSTEIGHEKAQLVIDSITSSYAAEGQANPMLQQPNPAFPPSLPGFPGKMAPVPTLPLVLTTYLQACPHHPSVCLVFLHQVPVWSLLLAVEVPLFLRSLPMDSLHQIFLMACHSLHLVAFHPIFNSLLPGLLVASLLSVNTISQAYQEAQVQAQAQDRIRVEQEPHQGTVLEDLLALMTAEDECSSGDGVAFVEVCKSLRWSV